MSRRKVNTLALEAARFIETDPQITITLAGEKYGVSRDSVSEARLVIEHGTARELMDAQTGAIGLSTIAKAIRRRLPPEIREARRRISGVFTDNRRAEGKAKAALWGKLGPALKGLNELPNPKDMIKVARGSSKRVMSVDQHLETALNWLKEFNDEWNRGTQDRANNAGNGDSASGTQHSKSAA